MASLATHLRKGYRAVKSSLSIDHFAVKFEHLSALLAIECLRFGELEPLMGIDPPSRSGYWTNRQRPDLDPAVENLFPALNALFKSLREINQRYGLFDEGRTCERRDRRVNSLSKSISKALPRLQDRHANLQTRLRKYREQTSPADLITWTLIDAGVYEDKINKLRMVLNDLEDILQALNTSRPAKHSRPSTTPSPSPSSPPPPYSAIDPASSLQPPQPTLQIEPSVQTPQPPPQLSPPPITTITPYEPPTTLQTYHDTLKSYLLTSLLYRDHPPPLPLITHSLRRLSLHQLLYLLADVHSDLVRRQLLAFTTNNTTSPVCTIPTTLSSCRCFSSARQKARRDISRLSKSRFGDLVSDLVGELETRWPELREVGGRDEILRDEVMREEPSPVEHEISRYTGDFSNFPIIEPRRHDSRRLGYCDCVVVIRPAAPRRVGDVHFWTQEGDESTSGAETVVVSEDPPLSEPEHGHGDGAVYPPSWPLRDDARILPIGDGV